MANETSLRFPYRSDSHCLLKADYTSHCLLKAGYTVAWGGAERSPRNAGVKKPAIESESIPSTRHLTEIAVIRGPFQTAFAAPHHVRLMAD